MEHCKNYVPIALGARVSSLYHNSTFLRHQREQCMYDSTRNLFFLSHLKGDVHTNVNDYRSCAQDWSAVKYKRMLQIFLPAESLGLLAMKLLGPLPGKTSGNQQVIIETERNSRLTRAIAIRISTSKRLSTILRDDWILPYGITIYVLIDKDPCSKSNSSRQYVFSC